TFESVQQIFNTESIPSISNPLSLSNLSSESNLSSISSQSSTSNLSYATEQLAKSLCRHPEIQQRKDGQSLSSKLLSENEWNKLEELITLLAPFAQMTKLIGESHYPTLSMMLPTISRLFTHLNQMKASLILPNILDVFEMATNTIDTLVQTEMDCFYDGKIRIEHLIDDELECYEK
ncbi:24026_t:CDS:2, partial [Gigaspora margarita]